jgi:hypothetical protein
MTLLEDHESVAHPKCHALGLIPYCLENPALRVGRRVSLWTNILLANPLSPSFEDREMLGDDELLSFLVTESVALWMVEGSALHSAGMPLKSFTLVLDGEPTPTKTTEVFQIVQRDAAWQLALDPAYKHNLVATTFFARRIHRCYHFEAFPEVFRSLVNGTRPWIKCNFETGGLVDIDDILGEHHGWSAEYWENAWGSHSPPAFETTPPLPPWREIIAANVLK